MRKIIKHYETDLTSFINRTYNIFQLRHIYKAIDNIFENKKLKCPHCSYKKNGLIMYEKHFGNCDVLKHTITLVWDEDT